jgi:molybdate transport system regulatory protein
MDSLFRMMQISARNQLHGRVTGAKTGAIMAEVGVRIEPATVTAVITKSSVDNLAIKPGDAVVVIIRSTEVIVGGA